MAKLHFANSKSVKNPLLCFFLFRLKRPADEVAVSLKCARMPYLYAHFRVSAEVVIHPGISCQLFIDIKQFTQVSWSFNIELFMGVKSFHDINDDGLGIDEL